MAELESVAPISNEDTGALPVKELRARDRVLRIGDGIYICGA